MTIGVNIITYNNPVGLTNLVKQFNEQGHTPRIWNTYEQQDVVLPDSLKAEVRNIGYNRSFARNVNESWILDFKNGHSHSLVSCDDLSVSPSWDKYLLDNAQYWFAGIASCFVATKQLVKLVGFYDERFHIGYEDMDFRIRMTQQLPSKHIAPDSQVNPPFSAKHTWLSYFQHLDHGPSLKRAVSYHDPLNHGRQLCLKKWGTIQGPYVRQPGEEQEINWYPAVER